jgi:hypothetical protein
MRAEHLDWTESLGLAHSVQPTDVGDVIQLLRSRAEALGNLKSNSEQLVTTREESGSSVIYTVPASPERIYVPTRLTGTIDTMACSLLDRSRVPALSSQNEPTADPSAITATSATIGPTIATMTISR